MHRCFTQGNMIKILEIVPHIYDHLILNVYAKEIQWGKEFIQQMIVEQLDTYVAKKNANTYYHRDNFLKWIINLNIKSKATNVPKENIGKSL